MTQVRHACGAVGQVQYRITRPSWPADPYFPEKFRIDLKEGYSRVAVRVVKAKGCYKEGDFVIWDVPGNVQD